MLTSMPEETCGNSLPLDDRDLPWERILNHLSEPPIMARRPEVHWFLKISMELALAKLRDKAKFTAHPWPSWKELDKEIGRRGLQGLGRGKFHTFWTGGWDHFRKDLSAYALATARLWELPDTVAQAFINGAPDVAAGHIRFSDLVTQVARLDDKLRQRTALDFLLQSAAVLDASCREVAYEPGSTDECGLKTVVKYPW